MCSKRTLGMCPLDWLESGALITVVLPTAIMISDGNPERTSERDAS
jgi:hypothetical protein